MKFTFDNGLEAEKVYDDAGKALALGEIVQLGRTGAGGSVYRLPKQPDFCVKVFHAQGLSDKAKRARLVTGVKSMLEMGDMASDPRFAWPVAAVYDKQKEPVGYAMCCASSDFKPIKSLFGGKASIKRAFPNWTRRDLAIAAKNIVDAVITLERRGVFVADFNPENFLVNAHGEVRLIDTDSYMFYGRSGRFYTSDMYFEENAAPEILRDPQCAGQPRTSSQSAFSSAVLAFQLLMLGQHPFSYVNAYDGRACGTPRENILAGMCPLGKGAPCKQDPRWFAVWSWLTETLKASFVTTFRNGQANPQARVPLEMLSRELDKFIYVCEHDAARCVLMPTEAKKPNPPRPDRSAMQPYGPRPKPRTPFAAGGCRMPRFRPNYNTNNQQPYRAFGGGGAY